MQEKMKVNSFQKKPYRRLIKKIYMHFMSQIIGIGLNSIVQRLKTLNGQLNYEWLVLSQEWWKNKSKHAVTDNRSDRMPRPVLIKTIYFRRLTPSSDWI